MKFNQKCWEDASELDTKIYICSYCNKEIASNIGYLSKGSYEKAEDYIYICHNCNAPTYFRYGYEQIPGSKYGFNVEGLPSDIEYIYNEARGCYSVNADTATVLSCRKILMSIACNEGAEEGKSFIKYIDYLNDKGYIPPNGREWVDKIRKLGNEATHKLETKNEEDAKLALNFTGMLLKFIYELPSMLR